MIAVNVNDPVELHADGIRLSNWEDDMDIPGVTIHGWDDLRLKLDEGLAAIKAGRVTPHEEVFEDLERKILTGMWDD